MISFLLLISFKQFQGDSRPPDSLSSDGLERRVDTDPSRSRPTCDAFLVRGAGSNRRPNERSSTTIELGSCTVSMIIDRSARFFDSRENRRRKLSIRAPVDRLAPSSADCAGPLLLSARDDASQRTPARHIVSETRRKNFFGRKRLGPAGVNERASRNGNFETANVRRSTTIKQSTLLASDARTTTGKWKLELRK